MVTNGSNPIGDIEGGAGGQDRDVMQPFAHAYDPLPISGLIRQAPEDFVVVEVLGFEPGGEGEHQWLQVEKRGITTRDAARALANHAGTPLREIGYSGLKDRNAVATQWFSVRVRPSKEPDWQALHSNSLRIVESTRHRRKLRRGSHRANRFRVVLRNLDAPSMLLQQRLTAIQRCGVPNYFAAQRFGRAGENLRRAEQLFAGRAERDRFKRGLYLSAARAWIFNHVLSQRVEVGTWDRLQPGDMAMLDGTRSVFPVTDVDAVLQRRVENGDVHPSGPLAGSGDGGVGRDVQALEAAVIGRFSAWDAALADAGLRHQRRSLRVWVDALRWTACASDTWVLEFNLQRGQFATALLRECGRFTAQQ